MTQPTTIVTLENSVHPHTLQAQHVDIIMQDDTVTMLRVNGNGIVLHGEHGTLTTEVPDVAKYLQQEANPVTQAMQNAFD